MAVGSPVEKADVQGECRKPVAEMPREASGEAGRDLGTLTSPGLVPAPARSCFSWAPGLLAPSAASARGPVPLQSAPVLPANQSVPLGPIKSDPAQAAKSHHKVNEERAGKGQQEAQPCGAPRPPSHGRRARSTAHQLRARGQLPAAGGWPPADSREWGVCKSEGRAS